MAFLGVPRFIPGLFGRTIAHSAVVLRHSRRLPPGIAADLIIATNLKANMSRTEINNVLTWFSERAHRGGGGGGGRRRRPRPRPPPLAIRYGQ